MISSFAQLASHGGGGRLVLHLAAAVGCWWWWWWCGWARPLGGREPWAPSDAKAEQQQKQNMFQQNTPTEKQSSRSASFLRPGICAGEHAVAWCHLRVPSHSASRSPCCKLLVCGVAGSVMTHEFLFFIPSCSTRSLVGWLVGCLDKEWPLQLKSSRSRHAIDPFVKVATLQTPGDG